MIADLSIIIVNWHSAQYMSKCLDSIYKNTLNLRYEIVVVDNASHDGCEKMLERKFPASVFIQSNQNVGFARANNLGARHAKGNYLLFLNPDTEVIGTAVDRMFSNLQRLKNGGAIGCKLLNSDLTIQTSCIQPFPNVLNQILDVERIKQLFPTLSIWGMRPLYVKNNSPAEVEVLSGACIMVRKDIFEMVGGFSDDYFMYSEDIDLCFKIKDAGLKVYFIGDAEIIHHGGGSSKRRDENCFNALQMRESVYKFIKKTQGTAKASTYKTAIMLVSLLRIATMLSIIPFLMSFGRKNKVNTSLSKWYRIFRWAIGLEPWVK